MCGVVRASDESHGTLWNCLSNRCRLRGELRIERSRHGKSRDAQVLKFAAQPSLGAGAGQAQ